VQDHPEARDENVASGLLNDLDVRAPLHVRVAHHQDVADVEPGVAAGADVGVTAPGHDGPLPGDRQFDPTPAEP